MCMKCPISAKATAKGGSNAVKEEEKKPIPWEVTDPKPPVIRSGRMESRKQQENLE